MKARPARVWNWPAFRRLPRTSPRVPPSTASNLTNGSVFFSRALTRNKLLNGLSVSWRRSAVQRNAAMRFVNGFNFFFLPLELRFVRETGIVHHAWGPRAYSDCPRRPFKEPGLSRASTDQHSLGYFIFITGGKEVGEAWGAVMTLVP